MLCKLVKYCNQHLNHLIVHKMLSMIVVHNTSLLVFALHSVFKFRDYYPEFRCK